VLAVVCAIALTRRAESLARRTTNNHIHLVNADFFCEHFGRKLREILMQCERVVCEVGLERLDSFFIEIYCGENSEPCALHSQAETAATTEKIEAGKFVSAGTSALTRDLSPGSGRIFASHTIRRRQFAQRSGFVVSSFHAPTPLQS
jgi:hypothetical protein